MRLVVDTNIIMAGLIRDGATRKLLFKHTLYAPREIKEELQRHKAYIHTKCKLPVCEAQQLFETIMRRISPVEPQESDTRRATIQMNAIDPDDTMFIACALTLSIPIWSNDRHVQEQRLVPVMTTRTLLESEPRRLS